MMSPIFLAIGIPLVLLGLFVFIDKYLNPIFSRRKLATWSKKLIKNSQKSDFRILEKAKWGTLTPDETSLQIKGRNKEVVTFEWADVEEIHAFKRDLFTIDLICIAFLLGKKRVVEIHEEMVGYHDLQPGLQKKFPEIEANWFIEVAFPAFATNDRVIWRKQNLVGTTSN